MNRRITAVLLAVIVFVCNFSTVTYAEETPDELKELYARSAVLIDADTGRILFGKNEEEILPMASTTKIMTCILALENMKENQIGKVSEYAAKQPKVHLGVQTGEEYFLKDLLYSLMLESHNDSAVIIAESIGGTVQEFAKMMNEKALQIGCENTYFITPNGLDAEDERGIHSTTSADLARIMKYCIQNSEEKEKFLEITRTDFYQFTDISGDKTFLCSNHNAFLGMMEGALSGKTGFTNDAGYCYVGALKRDERTFIVALLACGWPNNKGYKWSDTRKLMEYGIKHYEYRNVWQEMKRENIAVKKGYDYKSPFSDKIYVETRIKTLETDLKILLHNDEQIVKKIIYKDFLTAPVYEGETCGSVFYMLNGEVIYKYPVVISKDVKLRTGKDCILLIGERYFL